MKLICSVDFSLPMTRNTKDRSGLLLTWQILLDRMDGYEEMEVDEHKSLHLFAFSAMVLDHRHN